MNNQEKQHLTEAKRGGVCFFPTHATVNKEISSQGGVGVKVHHLIGLTELQVNKDNDNAIIHS